MIHLLAAPYTKVEESFNIQATHDILVYGTPTSNVHTKLLRYDHFEFPGAVPRTFLGSLLLAGVSQPIIAVVGFRYAQLIVRAVLGLANAASLLVFKRALEKEHGQSTARWFLILQASQFHILFYASRTLPNMFAFALSKSNTTAPVQLKNHATDNFHSNPRIRATSRPNYSQPLPSCNCPSHLRHCGLQIGAGNTPDNHSTLSFGHESQLNYHDHPRLHQFLHLLTRNIDPNRFVLLAKATMARTMGVLF